MALWRPTPTTWPGPAHSGARRQTTPCRLSPREVTATVETMAGAVQRIRPDEGNGDDLPPIDLYRLAVEEYRFQAEFNWKRTQYLLAFNVAILAAGTAVSGQFGAYAVPVFALGATACVLAILVMRQQRDSYRAARDRMARVENLLRVPPEARVDTTSTLGKRERFASVTGLIYLLTSMVAAADVGAVVYALTR